MSFAVSGLSSGLDTNALVEGLMAAERATIRRLESSKTQENRQLSAWGDIKTRLSAVEAAVAKIQTGGGLSATTAQSSNESVLRVTSQSGALPGSYAFQVDALAAAQQVTSAGLSSGADLVGAGTATFAGGFASIKTEIGSHTLNDGTYRLTVSSVDTGASEAEVLFDGVQQTVSIAGDGSFTVTAEDGGTLTLTSLGGADLETGSAAITVVEADGSTTVNNVVSKINADNGAMRAQLIDTGDGSATNYRLVITAAQTGEAHAGDIDVSALSLFSGGMTELRAASDAEITLGTGGLTITRPTNTIGDLFDGISVDLVGVTSGQDVEIIVAADQQSQVDAVTEVVTAVSSLLSRLAQYSSYDVDAGTGGALVGDSAARTISSDINRAMVTVGTASSGVRLLSQIGVTIERDGTYTVNEATLAEALADDPVAVQQLLVGDTGVEDDGVFDVLTNAAQALIANEGRVSAAEDAAQANIDQLDELILAQEVRLETVEARYRRQFTALETMIGQLQSQSAYLSSVLGQQGNS